MILYFMADCCVRDGSKMNGTCGIWRPPTPFITAPCIWWFIMGGWNERSMFELNMCWNCCWWNKFGSSNDCGRVIVSSAGDGWRDPGVRLQNREDNHYYAMQNSNIYSKFLIFVHDSTRYQQYPLLEPVACEAFFVALWFRYRLVLV